VDFDNLKFIDGSPAPKEYIDQVSLLVDIACRAEEVYGLDELELWRDRND